MAVSHETAERLKTRLYWIDARLRRYLSRLLSKAASWLWAELAKQITLVRICLVLVLLPIAWYVYTEAIREVIIIDLVSVPKRYEDLGLTSPIITARVAESLEPLKRRTAEIDARGFRVVNYGFLQANGSALPDVPDIEVPAIKLSLQTVVHVVQQVFHREPSHVRGEISFVWDPQPSGNADQQVEIRYHIYDGSQLRCVDSEQLQTSRPDDVVRSYSEGLLKRLNPYLWAVYLGWIKHDLPGAIRAADQIIAVNSGCNTANPKPRMVAMTYLLIGNALTDLYRPGEAIYKYQEALKLDPKYAFALNNWGNALRDLHDSAGAIEKYREALRVDPKLAFAYNNWANVLRDLHQPAQAIEKYKRALDIDPKLAFAYNGWGDALRDLHRPAEATEKIPAGARYRSQTRTCL